MSSHNGQSNAFNWKGYKARFRRSGHKLHGMYFSITTDRPISHNWPVIADLDNQTSRCYLIFQCLKMKVTEKFRVWSIYFKYLGSCYSRPVAMQTLLYNVSFQSSWHWSGLDDFLSVDTCLVRFVECWNELSAWLFEAGTFFCSGTSSSWSTNCSTVPSSTGAHSSNAVSWTLSWELQLKLLLACNCIAISSLWIAYHLSVLLFCVCCILYTWSEVS